MIETCDSPALEGEVCLHGGTCYGNNRDRPCRCPYNHAGKNCEIEDVVKCGDDDEVYCRNDGVCDSQNTGCVCAFGFMGPTCGEVNYAQLSGVSAASEPSAKEDSARLAGYIAAPLVIVILLMCAGGAYMVRKERATGKPIFVKQMDVVEMQPPRA